MTPQTKRVYEANVLNLLSSRGKIFSREKLRKFNFFFFFMHVELVRNTRARGM